MPVVTTSSKKQILLAAERLFAVHGIEGISLRQIGAAAGNGNNSAVQYHFGSKDRLIQAIFEYRLPWLHQRRLDLMAERGTSDLRGLVECQVRPLMEHSEVADSYYLTFVAMLKQYGRRDIFACIPEPMRTSSREFQEQLALYLPYIAEPLRTNRIAQAMSLVVEATAERQRAHAAEQPVLPFEVHLMDLLDAIIGFMAATVSTQTLDALAHTTPAPLSWASFI
ncbi:TetR family transcriptional regulator [Parafrankia colletiae]|uniref:TetR family transcriptional regulator n=1 Tax=Parafrankia colletiae TaxID=573497 RepID=A0A1S1QIE0_9ACTN|nr:TetR/AcrR family transcriptional regulator [Parafrankia colletiae]MCK9900956.1 TetR/AcrR family transcriptional regulator [Frankia sp. Cpl3]OHV34543.1 TetR family transcriptional regulator [Parafrankia colletiae]